MSAVTFILLTHTMADDGVGKARPHLMCVECKMGILLESETQKPNINNQVVIEPTVIIVESNRAWCCNNNARHYDEH